MQPPGFQGKWFEGFVHLVQQLEVGLRFGGSFRQQDPNQRFNVRFRYNRVPMRRQHQALDSTFAPARVLHPTFADTIATRPFVHMGPIHNQLINANPAQLLAIQTVVSQPPGAMPFIIFGP